MTPRTDQQPQQVPPPLSQEKVLSNNEPVQGGSNAADVQFAS